MTDDEFRDMLIQQNQQLIEMNAKALDVISQALQRSNVTFSPAEEYTDPAGNPYYSSGFNEDEMPEGPDVIPGQVIILEDLVAAAEKELDDDISGT